MPETEQPGDDAQAQELLADAQNAETVPGQPEQQREEPRPAATQVPDVEQWKALFGDDDPAKVKERLAHAREWEKRAKANSAAAAKLAEIEDAQKTEQQRLTDRLAEAERERDEERRGRSRLMAAATYDLPATLLDRIGGGTEEEIDESARALAAEIERIVSERVRASASTPPEPAATPPARPAPRRPVESLTPGARPANETPADPNDAFRDFLNARRT